jgi:hypothetical protein
VGVQVDQYEVVVGVHHCVVVGDGVQYPESLCDRQRPLQESGRLMCMSGILQYLLSGQALPQEKAEDDGCRPVHDDRPPRWRRQQIGNCR